VARGEYFQSGGSRFALRFTDPSGDAIVNDGTSLWLYLPSSARGQVMKLPSQAGAGMDVLAQLLAAPKANYSIVYLRDETVDGHATSVFALTPRRSDMPFSRATLWIGKSDALIWQLETAELSGLSRKVRFTAIAINVDLPSEALIFNAPAGTKVLDQGSLFGGKRP
jgi:outer membrane lipoprotein carrier protein